MFSVLLTQQRDHSAACHRNNRPRSSTFETTAFPFESSSRRSSHRPTPVRSAPESPTTRVTSSNDQRSRFSHCSKCPKTAPISGAGNDAPDPCYRPPAPRHFFVELPMKSSLCARPCALTMQPMDESKNPATIARLSASNQELANAATINPAEITASRVTVGDHA